MSGGGQRAATFTREIILSALLLGLTACGSQSSAPAAMPVFKLETVTAQIAGEQRGRSWDGVVEAVQQATLAAQTAGRVSAVNADVNDRVAAGAVLLRLTAVEQRAGADTARAQLRAAQAAAAEAETSYRRFAALANGQYVSRAQVDQARATRDSSVAARDAARAQLAQAGQQAEYTVVRAPFAGIVNAREVEPGESVVPGQQLMSLYAPGVLRIEVQVPQSDAVDIRLAGRARIVLDDGRSLDAAEVIVFPAADPSTHSVRVRVVLPGMVDAPQPGITAKVVFPTSGKGGLVHVPAATVVQRGEVSAVYVLDAGNRLALRQVRLGQRVGDGVEIIAGLKVGEKVALDPVAAGQALAAARRASAGAGHG